MKKLIVLALAAMSLTFAGCCKDKNCRDDHKPVAPETYQDGQSSKTDPQLPPMVPHWKETK